MNGKSRYTASTATLSDPPPRPSSISELAERALSNLWDPSKDFKHWLRVAERARNTGKEYAHMNDLENAFIEYARAAALILDKMPSHREYMTKLNASQRESLTLHGQELLKNLGDLKPVLTDRHNAWCAAHDSAGSTARDPRRREDEPASRAMRDPPRIQDVRHATNRDDARHRDREADAAAAAARRRAEDDMRREDEFWTRLNGSHSNHASHAPASAADADRRRRAEEKTRQEQLGIAQRQHQAEMDARVARDVIAGSALSMPRPSHVSTATSISSQYSSSSSGSSIAPPPILPLESPTHYDGDSTDAERTDDSKLYRRIAKLSIQQQPPAKTPFAPPLFHPPITTTSPPPPTLGAIQYPQLMSQHQRSQGYAPSLQSMFVKTPIDAPPSSLLFDRPTPNSLYANILPPPSAPVSLGSKGSYPGMPVPSPSRESREPQVWHPPQQRPPSTSQPPPRPPPKEPVQPPARIIPGDHRKDPVVKELRTVNFPRDTLPRFISIASLNTARNRETCGLLLGKPKGEKFVVTTLLIPKQHSTSDTCAMDEEELVLEFTEQRSLITLGWIHTHPTQSCFMSSVDLHTHSGFQCMLPESFAVVCAPQSTPNFGIFRLTDPPGLQTILNCNAKEAFHPHPDVPIYTDADKGHVQMKDMSLEIVDLR